MLSKLHQSTSLVCVTNIEIDIIYKFVILIYIKIRNAKKQLEIPTMRKAIKCREGSEEVLERQSSCKII